MANSDYSFCEEGVCLSERCDATCKHHDWAGRWVECFNADCVLSGDDAHKSPCQGTLTEWCVPACPNYSFASEQKAISVVADMPSDNDDLPF